MKSIKKKGLGDIQNGEPSARCSGIMNSGQGGFFSFMCKVVWWLILRQLG